MRDHAEDQSTGVEFDLHGLLMSYLHKWWVIVIGAILAGAIALGWTYAFVTPQYSARVTIYVNNRQGDREASSVSGADLQASTRLANTYISIITSDKVLDRVAEALGGNYTGSQISGRLRAAKMNDTEILRVTVTHPIPSEAARIANTVAEVSAAVLSELVEGSSARIIDTAKVPTRYTSPNYTQSMIKGAAAGVVLALVYLTIARLMDTRIKDEDELVLLFRLPVLGRVPDFSLIENRGGAYESPSPAHTGDAGRKGKK